MANLKSGFVGTLPGRVWRIEDSIGNLLCQFDSLAFPGFSNGSPVYYVDDLQPLMFAENVQPRNLLDQLVSQATPTHGTTEAAKLMLQSHVASKLFANTHALAVNQPTIVPQITIAMQNFAAALNANWSGRATVNALRSLGI